LCIIHQIVDLVEVMLESKIYSTNDIDKMDPTRNILTITLNNTPRGREEHAGDITAGAIDASQAKNTDVYLLRTDMLNHLFGFYQNLIDWVKCVNFVGLVGQRAMSISIDAATA
jgi:hypothetical protein